MLTGPYGPPIRPSAAFARPAVDLYHVHWCISSYINVYIHLSLFIRCVGLIDFTMYFRLIPQNPFRTVKYLEFRQTADSQLVFCYFRIYVYQYKPTSSHTTGLVTELVSLSAELCIPE